MGGLTSLSSNIVSLFLVRENIVEYFIFFVHIDGHVVLIRNVHSSHVAQIYSDVLL